MHDSNTDDIHLTSAFPTSSTSSSIDQQVDGQVSLLPPVVIPPQIPNDVLGDEVGASLPNNNAINDNIQVDSLTGITKKYSVILSLCIDCDVYCINKHLLMFL